MGQAGGGSRRPEIDPRSRQPARVYQLLRYIDGYILEVRTVVTKDGGAERPLGSDVGADAMRSVEPNATSA